MAHKIPVLNSTDKLKKSVALLHIRRQLAQGVYDERNRLIAVSYAPVDTKAVDIRLCRELNRTLYIPTKLPPAEIGGCRFVEPQSPSWRDYHRSAVPPSQIQA
jgi:hypothetical protein